MRKQNLDKKINERIFLDYASATPLDPRVEKVMRPYFTREFANPSAIYKEGVKAKQVLERSRKQVADIIHALPDEIVFTGSGTESANLALIGVFRQALKAGIKSPHIITSAFEHPAVLEAVEYCKNLGAKVTVIYPDRDGIISPKNVGQALRKDTVLVSVMYANNEIGTVQPIREIAKEIRRYKKKVTGYLSHVIFHVDASQAINYLPINVLELHSDLLTLDGSKIYGPKGVGILFVKRGVMIEPVILGGGQEKGRRSGTENVPAIVGIAQALAIADEEREKESKRLTVLQKVIFQGIKKIAKKSKVNGSLDLRLPNNINVCFPKVDAEFLVLKLDARGVAVSSSSSCKTISENSRSHVIEAIGGKDCAESSLRITLGRWTTNEEVKKFLKILKSCL